MPASVHSYGARSTTSIATTRSRTLAGSRKVKLKWYERRPILPNAFFIDLQKGSYLASIYSLVSCHRKSDASVNLRNCHSLSQLESLLQIVIAVFDIYCLIEAAPGSKHFRSFGISFMFVYSGNQHGEWSHGRIDWSGGGQQWPTCPYLINTLQTLSSCFFCHFSPVQFVGH